MGFLGRIFKKKEPQRAELIRELAQELAKNEASKPPDFVAELPLADGQTPDCALAEWYAITVTATTYALWASLGTQDKVSPILNEFQDAFLKLLSPGCKRIFLEIATQREVPYIHQIQKTFESGDAAQAMRLASAMGARITGHYDEALGVGELQPGCLDAAVLTGLWGTVANQIIGNMKLLKDLEKDVPRLF